jgi:hypothetical protein
VYRWMWRNASAKSVSSIFRQCPLRIASHRIASGCAGRAGAGLRPLVLGAALRHLVVRKGTRFRVTEANDSRLPTAFTPSSRTIASGGPMATQPRPPGCSPARLSSSCTSGARPGIPRVRLSTGLRERLHLVNEGRSDRGDHYALGDSLQCCCGGGSRDTLCCSATARPRPEWRILVPKAGTTVTFKAPGSGVEWTDTYHGADPNDPVVCLLTGYPQIEAAANTAAFMTISFFRWTGLGC